MTTAILTFALGLLVKWQTWVVIALVVLGVFLWLQYGGWAKVWWDGKFAASQEAATQAMGNIDAFRADRDKAMAERAQGRSEIARLKKEMVDLKAEASRRLEAADGLQVRAEEVRRDRAAIAPVKTLKEACDAFNALYR